MAQYAKNTNVSSELSRIEIEKVLIRYGAENFAYATANGMARAKRKEREREGQIAKFD